MTDEIKGQVAELSKTLEQKFTQYENELKETGSVSEGLKADLKKIAEENEQGVKALKDEMKGVNDELTALRQKGIKMDQGEIPKSMGKQFTDSDQFKNYINGQQGRARVEYKNTIIGEGGSPQDPTNTIVPLQTMPGIVGGAFRQLRVLDVIPQGTASGNQIHYTRENVFTNAAAETAEAAQKPETTLTFEAIDTPVRTIAHFIKVSKQVLDDAPALESYIDRRIRYGVNLRAEQQVVNGDGTSPNLSGILDSGNFTSITALSGENDFDFANRAKYTVIASDYMPDYYMVNPADWGAMERLQATDGHYIGGASAVGYLQNGLVPTLWGLPVIATNSVPQGKLICISSDATMFWNRQGTVVEIFDQNEDDVEKNLLTIRGEARGAFTVFRPTAIVAGDLPNGAPSVLSLIHI